MISAGAPQPIDGRCWNRPSELPGVRPVLSSVTLTDQPARGIRLAPKVLSSTVSVMFAVAGFAHLPGFSLAGADGRLRTAGFSSVDSPAASFCTGARR
jgi:hypothetical protein